MQINFYSAIQKKKVQLTPKENTGAAKHANKISFLILDHQLKNQCKETKELKALIDPILWQKQKKQKQTDLQ